MAGEAWGRQNIKVLLVLFLQKKNILLDCLFAHHRSHQCRLLPPAFSAAIDARFACRSGHEVIGVSADGALLDDARAEGFRIEALPLVRSLSPAAQWRAFLALVSTFPQGESPILVHAHMPISGFLASDWRRGRRGCRGLPIRAMGFCSISRGPWLRQGCELRDGVPGWSGHGCFHDRLARRKQKTLGRLHISRSTGRHWKWP